MACIHVPLDQRKGSPQAASRLSQVPRPQEPLEGLSLLDGLPPHLQHRGQTDRAPC